MLYTFLALSLGVGQEPAGSAPPVGEEEMVSPVLEDEGKGPAINILNPYGELSLPLQQAADRFVASRPGIEVRIRTVDSPAEYRTVLHSGLLAGQQIDLFHLSGYQDMRYYQDYVSDLSDLEWLEQAAPGALDPVRTDSALYGVPFGLEGVGLIADSRIFEAAGISLSSLETFEDLSEAFQELREQIDSGELAELFPGLQHVTEFPALDNAFLSEQVAGLALAGIFSSHQQAAESRMISFAPVSDALESYVKLMARYSSSRGDWEGLNAVTRNRQIEEGLVSGRVAVIQQSTDIYRRVYRADPELSSRLTLLPLPLDDGEPGSVYAGVSSWWAVNARASSASADLAREFLTWLYQTEEGQEILSDSFGVLSPFHDPEENTGVSLFTQLMNYIRRERTSPFFHGEAPRGWGAESFAPGLRNYFASEELNWQQFLNGITEDWTTIRKRSG